MGYLDEFFHVYASEHAKPNVLSLAEVGDMYTVTYMPGQAFIVHLRGSQACRQALHSELLLSVEAQSSVGYCTIK
jgi:hypothetical protein